VLAEAVAAERRKICSPWRKPWERYDENSVAPEGRNIDPRSIVPPLCG